MCVVIGKTPEIRQTKTDLVWKKKHNIKDYVALGWNAVKANPSIIENVPSEIDFVPVIQTTSGELSDYYNDGAYDENGNYVLVSGSSPVPGMPVTNVSTYLNGALTNTTSMDWTDYGGGYWLNTKIENTYYQNALQATVYSVVGEPSLLYASSDAVSDRIFAAIQRYGKKAVCALLPATAYAATPNSGYHAVAATLVFGRCVSEGAVFAGETFVLGAATAAAPISGGVTIAAYLTGWGLWTHSLHSFLHCLSQRT